MNADDYQHLAARTMIDEPDSRFTTNELAVMLQALDLSAKTGKVMEYLKKGICHRHGFDIDHLAALLADVVTATEDTVIAYKVPLNISVRPADQMLIWNALGLSGEAGEVAEMVHYVDHEPVDRTALTKELGDSQWYTAAICTKVGVLLSDVMQHNIDKLIARYPDGYSSERSINRRG